MSDGPFAPEGDDYMAPSPGTAASTELARTSGVPAALLPRMPMIGEAELDRSWRIAKALAISGMFKNVHQAEQAFAKILIGRDLGLSPTQSMMGIDLVEGAPMFRGVLLGSFVRKHPDYEYRITEHTDERCTVQMLGFPMDEPYDESMVRHRGQFWEVLGDVSFTKEDAENAWLIKQDKPKAAWNAYRKNMLLWRALSNAVKFHAPDLMGGIPVYVEGEIERRELTTGDRPAPVRVELPERLVGLLERVHKVDGMVWRRNEVVARLPAPDDPAYVPAVDGIAAEIERWLVENEVTDAEVVEGLTAEQAMERYQGSPEWRAAVEPLLEQREALQDIADDESASYEPEQRQQAVSDLAVVEDTLAEYGVPSGWLPVSGEQTTMEVDG